MARNRPKPAAAPVRQGSQLVEVSLQRLRAHGPFVNYRGGVWAPPKSKMSDDGRPVGHIKAFVAQILVDRELAEFTKFKKTRGGQIACELTAKR